MQKKKKSYKRGSNFSLIKSQDNAIQVKFHAVLKEMHETNLFICYGNNAKWAWGSVVVKALRY
jgi:hypothetical protein